MASRVIAGLAWMTALVLVSVVWPQTAVAQESRWEQLSAAGVKAYEARDLAEAEKQFSEALAEARRGTPEDWRLVVSLQNLAQVAEAQGRDGDAEVFYRRALSVGEALRGPDAPAVVEALKTLTWFYHARRRYREAEQLYERGRNTAARSAGPDHPRVAAYINQLADLARLQGRFAEAEARSREALQMLRHTPSTDDLSIAVTMNDLAWVVRVQGRAAEAKTLLNGARAILQRGGDVVEPALKAAVRVREGILGRNHPSVAKSFADLALFFQARRRFEEAEQSLQVTLRLLERASPLEGLNVVEALDRYTDFLRTRHREAEARTLEARAAAIRAQLSTAIMPEPKGSRYNGVGRQ